MNDNRNDTTTTANMTGDDKPIDKASSHPEWIWYCESTSGVPVISLGRWPKHPQQRRYKYAEIQETEHDHPEPAPQVTELREALKWYCQQAKACRMLTKEGDKARQALDADGGKRASAALAGVNTPPAPQARPLSEWHEEYGFVTWWKFPVNEPSYIGSPLCDDWPGYHTHWTPHPDIPANAGAIAATDGTS